LDSVSVSTGGADGPELQNWGNESISFCDWEGIDCDEAGNINILYLENQNITGTFPLSITYLCTFSSNFLRLQVHSLLLLVI